MVIYLDTWKRLVSVIGVVILLGGCSGHTTVPNDAQSEAYRLGWGVFVPDDRNGSSDLYTIKNMAGSSRHYVLRFAAIDDKIQIPQLSEIHEMGAIPILTLEPWQPGAGPVQPDYQLSRIAAGSFDAQLDAWARNLAESGQPVILRFAHEMNTDRYPWSVGINNNTAGDYVAAWHHLRERFAQENARNVQFMWGPNAPYEGAASIAQTFPGTDAVDVLALDGYNWGDGDGHTWKSPEENLRGRNRAVALSRPSSSDPDRGDRHRRRAGVGVDKANWIADLVNFLGRQDRVSGFVWFSDEQGT